MTSSFNLRTSTTSLKTPMSRKRGDGKGYAGIQNALSYGDNCNIVYGDAQVVLVKMIEAVRGLGLSAAA